MLTFCRLVYKNALRLHLPITRYRFLSKDDSRIRLFLLYTLHTFLPEMIFQFQQQQMMTNDLRKLFKKTRGRLIANSAETISWSGTRSGKFNFLENRFFSKFKIHTLATADFQMIKIFWCRIISQPFLDFKAVEIWKNEQIEKSIFSVKNRSKNRYLVIGTAISAISTRFCIQAYRMPVLTCAKGEQMPTSSSRTAKNFFSGPRILDS